MRAAVLHQFGEPFSIDEVPDPEPGAGQVRMRIGGAGACHSDLHITHGVHPDVPVPQILGHENAGWVDALGPGASGFEVGEPVMVFGGWGCGQCRFCLGGQEQVCDTMRWGGLKPPGGYAEYLVVAGCPASAAHRRSRPGGGRAADRRGPDPLPGDPKVAPQLAAGGTTVLLIGAGGLGQMAVQLLELLTPAAIVVADLSADKRATR